MNELQINEKLYDRYADAVTALVMDRYVSALAEALAAEERAEVEIGTALDSRCRKLIKKGYARQLRRSIGRKLLRGTSVAVVVFLLLCGVFAILFSTVEAIRVPIVNYFNEIREEEPESGDDSPEARANADAEARAEASGRNYLAGLLPAGYELAEFTDEDGILNVVYKNSAGEEIRFELSPKAEGSEPDAEDAVTETLTIGGCGAALSTKDGSWQIVWSRDGEAYACRLEAAALSREDLVALAEAIESRREGAPSVESDPEEPAPSEDKAAAYNNGSSENIPIISDYSQSDQTNGAAFFPYEIHHADVADIPARYSYVAESAVDSDFYMDLFDMDDDQLIWSSVDGEQTGDESISWTALP